ncbi:hypothetical protein L207DRAFT_520627 [Hyaloscypha variabilis F]|uniref:DNA polymerase delta subunit 3 n=1 Tax=Hyaloscypha variabilis (strain UAMH 11265 / GT02V1 / F) TaxID=1149755 RepID=A0A2J6QUR3_HYAVF|nr:hypothetical protein L207DRAFT_520627 [Hyaloscypha variabilis F]
MADYKKYLASGILTEDKVITYRILSRALKVHVNVAKEMLYDFHQKQNAKKPGTIHATYLLSGTKRLEDPIPLNGEAKKDGEDDFMQSSPFMDSSMPQLEAGTGESSVLSITLVREEDLEDVRSQYEHISSIHIYSLGPHPLKDLQVLSDATRELKLLTADEDPLETASKYGSIINKNVKRRTARRPPAAAAAPAPAPLASKAPAPAPAAKPKPEPKTQPSTANDFFGKGKAKAKATTTAENDPPSKESTPAPGPATLKKESSSIFKSFAKAKPKLKREGTDSSVVEDSPMRDVDDEDEEETYVLPPQPSKEIVNSDRKARKEREEELRRMMDEEDEDEAEVVEKPKEKEVVKEESVEPEKEEKSVVSGGRRRGRRRIMKKKTVKDAEGYLVTKEEPVWESFSEEEAPAAPKPKVAAPSISKGKKSTAKAGQGNIMSFFGKK